MRQKNKIERDLSRRDFIKTTAVGVGATALSGVKKAGAREAGIPEKWDKETDVVVAGCGGAGTTAAITAHDAGAKVMIVEKAPEGGGNSRVGGGQFSFSTPEKKDDAARYLYAACNGTTPEDVCRAWADEMVYNKEWLERFGVPLRSMPDNLGGADFKGFPGSDGIDTAIMNNLEWYKIIERQIRDRGIEIMFNTPAVSLIQDHGNKEILGVKVKSAGKDRFIKARRGVVLCTGGFEFNEDMKKNYLRPGTIRFTGWIYNTGDGIKMAQAVGADLWHMNIIASALYTIVTPESEMGWAYPEPKGGSFILVNKYGQRFMKEGEWNPHRSIMGYCLWDWRDDRKDSEYPLCPHYMIFDETTRIAGGIGRSLSGMGNIVTPTWLGGCAPGWGEAGGEWSEDNSVEIEKGWIKKADTIGALAGIIGGEMTADTLTATVTRWNGFCDAGVDSDFGRASAKGMRSRKMEKIQRPPFYAVELWPGGFSTCGGPRKNAEGQVLGVDGDPIKRLYEAGTLGHTCGQVYSMSGANYCECFVWGRISGRNVAALKPWS